MVKYSRKFNAEKDMQKVLDVLQKIERMLEPIDAALKEVEPLITQESRAAYARTVREFTGRKKALLESKRVAFKTLNDIIKLMEGDDVRIRVDNYEITVGQEQLIIRELNGDRWTLSETYPATPADAFHLQRYNPLFWKAGLKMAEIVDEFGRSVAADDTMASAARNLQKIQQMILNAAKRIQKKS